MKIQFRLMLVIIPVLIAVFGITTFTTSSISTSALEDQARTNAKLLSHSYADQLDSTIEFYSNISQDLGIATITAINIEATLQAQGIRYPQFTNIFYTPATGKILEMAPYQRQYVGFDLKDIKAWQKAFDTKSPAISAPGEYFGEKSIIIFAPAILSYVVNQEPTIVGMVALVLPLDHLFQEINNVIIGNSGSIFAIDENGLFLHHEEEERILTDNLATFSTVPSLSQVAQAMTNQKTGFATYSDKEERKYIAFSPILTVNWSLGVNGSYKEITSGINKIILINLFVVIIGIILAIVILYFVVHSVVSPIEKLTAMARRIEKGDYQYKISIDDKGMDELAELTKTFINMSDSIKEKIESLNKEVTEREQAEKKLKEFAQRLSIHVEQTPLGVIEWDLDFNVTQWNNAAENIFGYSKKEAIGKTGLELVVPKEIHNLVQPIWNDLAMGKGRARSTNDNITKDGNTIICEWYNTTLLDSNGIAIGVASLVQDITDQKNFEESKDKLEKQLQQSQKMEAIGTLAGGIAHDFNNILGIILGYSDLLKNDLSLNATSVKRLDAIIKSGNRAKDLVYQILAFSRQNKKEFIPFQPDLIVKEALKMLRSSIPTTIKIESNISKSDSIIGDPTQLHQIMMNLCTNAYHAMRETGGVLKVLLENIRLEENDTKALTLALCPGSYAKLEISDNGHGMEKATQQKIFDPYFTTKKIGEGTGLGLSVVHGIVKDFGGNISVYSEPSIGTTFRIYFPQVITETEIAIKKSNEPIPTGKEHLLVVDDEKLIVEMEKSMLEGLGYQVSTCTSSSEALKKFQNQPEDFALVITDMTMPDMTGIELVQRIRTIRSNIPVILCSGFSELINEEKAKYIDNLKYLNKPVLTRDFAVALREILENDKKLE